MGGSNSSHRKSEVRIGHSLNKEEEEFVAMRRKTVQQNLQKLELNFDLNEVPNIALLGSGGGERAMVGLLGSLDQLKKTGLLDCVLYLSGVSGSTWCMASLYQEPDWSTKLETVKDKITQRLSGPAVSWGDAFDKLKKYYHNKDTFSLTDVWAAMVVTTYVKEIDEHKLSDQWDQQSKDPFPIYTAIDKQCKEKKDADPWFEFTPYEAGYSLTGAFVETSSFGSKFENGRKIKNQPEMDILYLQASAALFLSIIKCVNQWTWGRNNNFLYNMKDEAVPAALLESETRDYIDAGLLLNSPYFSVLREERNIDLIISLDFSDGDPFMTVREVAETCKKRNIPFPEVNMPSGDIKKLKDFYVFKGQNTPTVIHIPLFNAVNCGDKIEEWRNKYTTIQGAYSAEMITDLMEVAGKNITNNKDNLLKEIRLVAIKKWLKKLIYAFIRESLVVRVILQQISS